MQHPNDDENRALVTMTRRELEQLIDKRVKKALDEQMLRIRLHGSSTRGGHSGTPMETKAYEQH